MATVKTWSIFLMAMVPSNGLMELPILETSEMAKPMAKEGLVMQMVILTKVHLSTTRLTVLESTFTTNKCKNIKASGKTTCNTAMAEKNFATILFTKAISSKGKNMAKENIFGQTPQFMKVSGKTTK